CRGECPDGRADSTIGRIDPGELEGGIHRGICVIKELEPRDGLRAGERNVVGELVARKHRSTELRCGCVVVEQPCCVCARGSEQGHHNCDSCCLLVHTCPHWVGISDPQTHIICTHALADNAVSLSAVQLYAACAPATARTVRRPAQRDRCPAVRSDRRRNRGTDGSSVPVAAAQPGVVQQALATATVLPPVPSEEQHDGTQDAWKDTSARRRRRRRGG